MARNKSYDMIKTQQKGTIQKQIQEQRKEYEQKNLLQCRGHCKNAWCEYGESLQNP